MMKNVLSIIVFLLFFVCFGQAQQPDQQQRLYEFIDTNSKFYSISKPLLEELIKDEPGFFGKYSDALAAVDILSKLSNAEDAQAFESAILFLEGKLVEKIFPGLGSVLSWAAWAKTGMDVLINFVINPALLSAANESYYNNRKIFNQEEAIINIYSWGNIEQQLLGQFRKEYGDYAFKEIKPSGMVLLPKWKTKFDRYVVSWFEYQYQNRKFKEFQKEAKAKLKDKKNDLQEKTDYFNYLIEKKLNEIDHISIFPDKKNITINESVTFNVYATDKGERLSEVTELALSISTFVAVEQGAFTITANFKGKSASSVITVTGDNICEENELWDTTLKDCICKQGYVKNNLDVCVKTKNDSINIIPSAGITTAGINNLLNHADCANISGAIAKWDPVNEQVICTCTKEFYTWDYGQKKCIPNIQAILANSDCSQWANTEPKWDYGNNQPYCDCVSGYVWNDDYNKCVSQQDLIVAQTDCSQYLNTQPIWDPVNNKVICDCLPGFEWDKNYTKCISKSVAGLQNFDCSMFPNTQSIWDPVKQQAFCDCLPGYEWNAGYTACEKPVQQQINPSYCAHLPNTRAIFDSSLNEWVCDCLPGFKWNRKQTACEPIHKKPNINWNNVLTLTMGVLEAVNGNTGGIMPPGYGPGKTPTSMQQPVRHQSNCNDQQQAGENVPEVHTIDLGQSYGSFIFDYQTFTAKDQIIITNGGRVIFNSGCVGEKKSVQLNLGYSPTITVRVNPNCDGGSSTQWNFTVHCPRN